MSVEGRQAFGGGTSRITCSGRNVRPRWRSCSCVRTSDESAGGWSAHIPWATPVPPCLRDAAPLNFGGDPKPKE